MHPYILEPYRGKGSRYSCPKCGHRRHTFKRYINSQTFEPLADHVGRCDREEQCGYHYRPREYFAATPGTILRQAQDDTLFKQIRVFDTLPRGVVDETAKAYGRNNFIQFLIRCFGEHIALKLAALYKIGTSKHWPGATIYWQIDGNDKVRTGKIMLYNSTDGHRVKEPFNHIHWAHALSGNTDFNLKQCFFGEHLLNSDPYKTVAIAESEKTAVICSFFYTKYIWLAAGSLEGLNRDKYSVLNERNIRLYPDVNGYEKWKQKAREMKARMPGATVTVDDTLERTATEEERKRGIDIADRWIDQLNLEP